jgi:hypothetical protein
MVPNPIKSASILNNLACAIWFHDKELKKKKAAHERLNISEELRQELKKEK